MDDIGSTDDTALLCHTNKVLPKVIGGDWLDPDGTKVGNVNEHGGVPGVERNRGPHVVRLKRSSDGTPPEGMYKCVVRDTTDTNQTVYVGISSSVLLSSSMLTGDSVTRTSSIFKTSEVDVTVTSSTRTKNEDTSSSSHLTPTQTVLYTSSEGTPTSTPTVVYTSRATKTQTGLHSFSEGNATLPVPTSGRGITTLAQTLPTSTQKDSTSSGGETSGN